ncbi:acyl carrier protein [Streptomyces netropsis]|uniref:Acyl carrier protein n=1 Tax=Streptomyces syringium TaxID=76729 RepID=A0ABS4YBL4_9ACTN|nr:acyl carrier protein [Streptomyces syringium]MBP2406184.1 acyl carrier protein [Streptomyces syringium]SPE63916.1 acyl carrier protein [Streptomyces netropsis]
MGTADEIHTLLVKKFGADPGAVHPDASLHGLRVDSLALEELRVIIENRLDIDLDDVQLSSRSTVGELVAAVQGRLPA